MVRNQVRFRVRHEITIYETSRTDRTEIHSNYIKNQVKKASSAKSIQSSKLVVTIAQIKSASNSKTLGNNELQ